MDQFVAEGYAQKLCIRYVSAPRNQFKTYKYRRPDAPSGIFLLAAGRIGNPGRQFFVNFGKPLRNSMPKAGNANLPQCDHSKSFGELPSAPVWRILVSRCDGQPTAVVTLLDGVRHESGTSAGLHAYPYSKLDDDRWAGGVP